MNGHNHFYFDWDGVKHAFAWGPAARAWKPEGFRPLNEHGARDALWMLGVKEPSAFARLESELHGFSRSPGLRALGPFGASERENMGERVEAVLKASAGLRVFRESVLSQEGMLRSGKESKKAQSEQKQEGPSDIKVQVVRSDTGKELPDLKFSMLLSNGSRVQAKTDAKGSCEFSGLPSGNCTFTLESEGWTLDSAQS